MSNNGKDTKHTKHISRGVYSIINDEERNMHKTVWREENMILAYIETNKSSEGELNSRL